MAYLVNIRSLMTPGQKKACGVEGAYVAELSLKAVGFQGIGAAFIDALYVYIYGPVLIRYASGKLTRETLSQKALPWI